MGNLGSALGAHYDFTGDLGYLDKAIAAYEWIFSGWQSEDDPPSWAIMVGNLASTLVRAQEAGAVRPDVAMPEVPALITATCLAADRQQWDEVLRTRTLAVVFDGLRPQ
ncbi:hypothetical protein StrepF001_44390 [Streptomyces sp. F001]|uniref:SbtR family transcriptional regulator n=1 Tax=Streptomyces sp. F001 TaxID=1510026 RepID=UPI00101E6A37|nr:hypothetical protein [Streptomyces sp. F001]RZB13393.1 hypothetical protein StrepF001_44390 [Streptomyces sp. F001]